MCHQRINHCRPSRQGQSDPARPGRRGPRRDPYLPRLGAKFPDLDGGIRSESLQESLLWLQTRIRTWNSHAKGAGAEGSARPGQISVHQSERVRARITGFHLVIGTPEPVPIRAAFSRSQKALGTLPLDPVPLDPRSPACPLHHPASPIRSVFLRSDLRMPVKKG